MLKLRSKKLLSVLLIVIMAATAYLYLRPLPSPTTVSEVVSVPKTRPTIMAWPSSGQAAIGASGYGVLESHNAAAPASIASIAKVITALAVLQKKPITAGSQGPILTLNPSDVDIYNSYYSKDGSVAKVTAGEQLSEYQALQTVLIPSANNMADSLANWAFGSVDAYVAYANQMVKSMGLTHTTVTDASGFGDTTTSTADDLVKLGLLAVKDPTISQISSQPSAQVPVAGTVKNVNWLLGQQGVFGIKTGNTDKAGGCYLFSTKRTVAGHEITLIGAILGAPQLNDALSQAVPLIKSADNGFTDLKVVSRGQVLGYYKTAWGAKAQFKSAKDVSLLLWMGKDIRISNNPEVISVPAMAGASSGMVKAASSGQAAGSSLVLAQDLNGPSWHWRLFHN